MGFFGGIVKFFFEGVDGVVMGVSVRRGWLNREKV
jgi:hypothetical protein